MLGPVRLFEAVGAEGVLHGRVGQHQLALQQVQRQRVDAQRLVQGEGVHLEAGDVGQSAGDLLGQTGGRVSCRGRERVRTGSEQSEVLVVLGGTCEDDVGDVLAAVSAAVVLVLVVEPPRVAGLLQLQRPRGVGRELVLTRSAVVQAVDRTLSRELEQRERTG